MLRHFAALILASVALTSGLIAADPAPLKVLLITGGCCHDYKTQKDIIKSGLEARVNCVVEQIHVDDKSTKPPFPHHGNADYAKGFDLVIHDECAADIKDVAVIDAVLKPHMDGMPAINLHCAMHSYRFGDIGKPVTPASDNAKWFLYLGLQTTGHGPQEPINIVFVDKEHPITKGLADWMTIKEELYNNVAIHGGYPLARGKQKVKDKDVETVVAWTNEFGPKKAKIFSTTIGHNNDTVADPRYLDLVSRAVLWTTGHINADGTAATGYGKK
jgi:Trehalose utilisation